MKKKKLAFEQEVRRLSDRNHDISSYLKVINAKSVRKRVCVDDFCKYHNIKNVQLDINTLKYFKFKPKQRWP